VFPYVLCVFFDYLGMDMCQQGRPQRRVQKIVVESNYECKFFLHEATGENSFCMKLQVHEGTASLGKLFLLISNRSTVGNVARVQHRQQE
jgi:hypothetical protein